MAFSARQARFLAELRSALGTPYVWGGTSLRSGVDCSGLVQAAARAAGIRGVPRTSQEQFTQGTPVGIHQLRPGDLVFSKWGSEVGAGHVSVYIGGGKIIEAAGRGIPVRVANIGVLDGHILGARRYLAGAGQGLPNVSAFAKQQIAYHAQASGQQEGNPAAAAAALSQIHPIQVTPGSPLPTALGSLQGALRPSQVPGQALPTATPFLQNTAPTSGQLGSSLDAIHAQLLPKVKL